MPTAAELAVVLLARRLDFHFPGELARLVAEMDATLAPIEAKRDSEKVAELFPGQAIRDHEMETLRTLRTLLETARQVAEEERRTD